MSTAILEPPASASALRLPSGWSRWQWLCVLLAGLAFALLLANERARKETDHRQTVTCEVLATGGPAGPLEVSLASETLAGMSVAFKVPAQPAGSAGQLAHYEFPLLMRGLEGVALLAPGQVRSVRLYHSDGASLAHLSAEAFHPGKIASGRGIPVVLRASKDGSEPAQSASIDRGAAPVAPGAFYRLGWWAFYAAIILGLAALLVQLFAPGRSWDLRRYAARFDALARLAERTRPLQLGLAVGLALAMAAVSAPNAHPDEYQHVAAARYYRNGAWLPPAMGDLRARDAIGPNGLSYHQDLDIVYLLAGKASHVTGLLAGREDFALRLVNVAMFATLAALICRKGVCASAWILLVCPQVWYVFSYFNGDAMGLFLSILAVWQLAGRETLLQRALYGQKAGARGLAGMGLLLGLILISKKNYFPAPLLAGGFAAWQWWGAADRVVRRRLAVRWSLVAAIAFSIYGLRAGYDASLYGFHKTERIREVTEALATPEYRPSQVREPGAHWYLGMRERGIPVTALLTNPRWRVESFMSFVGLYGWMTIPGPREYYEIMQYLYLAFGTAVLFEYLRGANGADLALVPLCLSLCGVTLAASIYFSWTVGFQPQGRYLFPMLPILAVLGLRKPEALRAPLPIALGGLIFLASVYSFTMVALVHIAK